LADHRDNCIKGLSLRLQKSVAPRVEKNRPGNAWPIAALFRRPVRSPADCRPLSEPIR
jgi:hypothetical protein